MSEQNKYSYEYADEIELVKNQFITNIYPNIYKKDVNYICGPFGSGKSSYCNNYSLDYNEKYTNKDIFLISINDHDIVYDSRIIKLYNYDKEMVKKTNVSFESLADKGYPMPNKEDSLLIFDIYDKKIRNNIDNTIRERENTNTDIWVVSNLPLSLNNFVYENLSSFTTFTTGIRHRRICKNILGIDNCVYISNLINRYGWVTISNTNLPFVLYKKGCVVKW